MTQYDDVTAIETEYNDRREKIEGVTRVHTTEEGRLHVHVDDGYYVVSRDKVTEYITNG